LADLTPGAHRIGLAGVASHCTVQGDNPRTLTVVAGETATADLAVLCADGTLTVTTATSGTSGDPDGYAFAIGSGASRPIGASATVSVARVAAGATTVALSGVAAGCAVGGENPPSPARPTPVRSR
jgi:hypothetical protein